MSEQRNFIKLINESRLSETEKLRWEIFINSDESEKFTLDEIEAFIKGEIIY